MNNDKITTFIIPVRIDSNDRLRNLSITLNYLKNNFTESVIMVTESDEYQKTKDINFENIEYTFIYDNNDFFHRTKILNEMTFKSKTPIIINYDLDCLIQKEAYDEACNLILNKDYDLIFPYGHGNYIKYINSNSNLYNSDINFNNLDFNKIDNSYMGRSGCGHVKFHKKESYIKSGMENENFISWGSEDGEIYNRYEILEYKKTHINYLLCHLEHERSINSSSSNPYCNSNIDLCNKLSKYSKEELINYYSNIEYMKKYIK